MEALIWGGGVQHRGAETKPAMKWTFLLIYLFGFWVLSHLHNCVALKNNAITLLPWSPAGCHGGAAGSSHFAALWDVP